LKSQKNKEHIQITTKYPANKNDVVIKTDPVRLKQILFNLVGNALKFTEKGKIEFGFKIVKKQVVFTITDTGIGMPKNELEAIFERFHRIENNSYGKYDGTGLGLSISKGIISLLKGSISAESKLGKGSTFKFQIPYAPVKLNTSKTVEKSAQKSKLFDGKKIMVVDDIYKNKVLFEKMLTPMNLQIIWANSGPEAIEIYTKHKEIMLILMDIRMPIMDGYSAAKIILEKDSNAKIIAQTANAMTGDKEKCLDNGFVDYISKPIDEKLLIEKIIHWMS